jgi:hypothetical protein
MIPKHVYEAMMAVARKYNIPKEAADEITKVFWEKKRRRYWLPLSHAVCGHIEKRQNRQASSDIPAGIKPHCG